MTDIEILNRRLGESLGRPNGTDPRFAWMQSTDLFYFFRRNMIEGWRRRCWADRIGKCWLLCQWRPPEVTVHGVKMELTREQWMRWFNGQRPFPAKGEYIPHAETALGPEQIPTAEGTAFYIAMLRQQMDQAERAQRDEFAGRKDAVTEQCEREAVQEVETAENQFYQQVGDWEPLSWKLGEPHDPGDHDGPVAFQVGGLRDEINSTKEAAV